MKTIIEPTKRTDSGPHTEAKRSFLVIVYKYPIIFATILFGLYVISFSLVEEMEPPVVNLIDLQIDHLIPFTKYASLLYCMWHLEILAVLVDFLRRKDREGFWNLTVKMIAGLFLILLICIIFPNEVALRPDAVEGNDFFAQLTRLVYSLDNSRNVFPSGHALCATLMFQSLYRIYRKPWQITLNAALNIGIILSTMFLKQHSLIDLPAGIVLALIIDKLVEYTYQKSSARIRASQKS